MHPDPGPELTAGKSSLDLESQVVVFLSNRLLISSTLYIVDELIVLNRSVKFFWGPECFWSISRVEPFRRSACSGKLWM